VGVVSVVSVDSKQVNSSTLRVVDFAGGEATVKFNRMFNKLFDLLTSRNSSGKGFKSPLQQKNIAEYIFE